MIRPLSFTRRGLLSVVVVAGFAAALSAGPFVVFGPDQYVRDTAKPGPVTKAFSVLDPSGPYTIRIDTSNTVSSAVVTLNGVDVFTEKDFNPKVAVLTKPVRLAAHNRLTVDMKGKVGESLTVQVIGVDNAPPTITAGVSPPPNASGWNNKDVTVAFTCSDAGSGVASCPQPVVLSSETSGSVVSGTAVDKAGNTSTAMVTVKLDKTAPAVTPNQSPAANKAGWNNTNVTVSLTGTDSLSGIANCSPAVTLSTEGANQSVSGSCADKAGNVTPAVINGIKIDKTAPTFTIGSPANGATLFATPAAVTGAASDGLSGLAAFACNGIPATLNGSAFSCNVPLATGANTISATATDVAGNSVTSTITVSYAPGAPKLTINTPANLSYLNITPTTVTGTIDDPTATVQVNSVQAAVVNGAFSVALPLAEGPNIITATGKSASGAIGTASIEVTLDTTPPHVTITSPPDLFVTTDAVISVAGIVNDIVVGTVNAEQAQVSVNGVQAQVANRTFLAASVPLRLGNNLILVTGRDRVGNSATTQVTVTRQAAASAQIRVVSGNNQTGVIGSILPAPLVIALTDAAGAPVPNKPVIFKVTQNNGLVSNGGATAGTLLATTNSQGQAQVQWTLGKRSGAGANVLEAYSVGFGGTAIFVASGTAGAPTKIVVDIGNNQMGVIGQPLPKPLIAVVVDGGNNRLSNVPVAFSIKAGGGKFGVQPSFTVNSDSDGRVAAAWTLGLQEGNSNNIAEATFPANPGSPATFTASGRASGDPSQTTITGVVLDNRNAPIPGVTVHAVLADLLHSNAAVIQSAPAFQTDAQGQVRIPQAPVGLVKLLIDGSTAQFPGTYPSLEYDMITVAGNVNDVGQPIYLLPLTTDNQVCVTATTGGGTLTMPDAPGFSLTFGPGQVTFPGGSKSGCVSVTVVHRDKVPMSPAFGQQPRFIVTIQPPGAIFNPPAPVTFPNVDGLSPREVTEMYSFDHDINQFVAIGVGTVGNDGQVIRSNSGVGVLKAGWHGSGAPAPTGTADGEPPPKDPDGQPQCPALFNGGCAPTPKDVDGSEKVCKTLARVAYCEAFFGTSCELNCSNVCDPEFAVAWCIPLCKGAFLACSTSSECPFNKYCVGQPGHEQ